MKITYSLLLNNIKDINIFNTHYLYYVLLLSNILVPPCFILCISIIIIILYNKNFIHIHQFVHHYFFKYSPFSLAQLLSKMHSLVFSTLCLKCTLPPPLKNSLIRYKILSLKLFFLSTLKISFHSLLASTIMSIQVWYPSVRNVFSQ